MKVLMVGPIETAGGVSTHTKELTKALRKRGLDVEVYNINPDRDYPPFVSRFIKLYKRTLGLSWILLKDSGKFDVVHIQASGPMGGFIPAIIGAFWKTVLGFRLVVTFHYRSNKEFLLNHKKSFKLVISHSEVFFVVSNAQVENLKTIFGETISQKVMTIYNGFDGSSFKNIPQKNARSSLGLPSDKKIILSVGNLLPVKGYEYLITATKEIVKKRKDILFIVIGDGPLRKKLESIVSELELKRYFYFAGIKQHSEIPLWMNAADLFVLPSLNEGNPTVMFEALGVGLPFIGTAVGGVPEIITSEDYGLLCPPADPECLAEKILMGLEKDWDREKIRKYAKQFTWEEIAKEVMGVYNEILKE